MESPLSDNNLGKNELSKYRLLGYLFLAIVFVIAVTIVYLKQNPKQSDFKVETQIKNEATTDWSTYENDKYGFTMEYPKEAIITSLEGDYSGGPGEGIFHLYISANQVSPEDNLGADNAAVMVVRIGHDKDGFLSSVRDLYSQQRLGEGSYGEVSFNGFQGYSFSSNSSEYVNVNKTMSEGKIFVAWTSNNGTSSYTQQDYLLPMLSSIKFEN